MFFSLHVRYVGQRFYYVQCLYFVLIRTCLKTSSKLVVSRNITIFSTLSKNLLFFAMSFVSLKWRYQIETLCNQIVTFVQRLFSNLAVHFFIWQFSIFSIISNENCNLTLQSYFTSKKEWSIRIHTSFFFVFWFFKKFLPKIYNRQKDFGAHTYLCLSIFWNSFAGYYWYWNRVLLDLFSQIKIV